MGKVLPAQMGVVAGQGFHFLMIGLVALAIAVRGAWGQGHGQIAVGGLGLYAGPLLAVHGAQRMGGSSLDVLVFALVPVAVMVISGAGMRLLGAALAGVAGVLVLLPVTVPQGRGLLGAGLMVVAMGMTAASIVGLHRVLARAPFAATIAILCLANGLVLMAAGWRDAGWSMRAVEAEVVRCLVLDVPEVVLMVWLVRVMEPQRIAARWLVAPLLTVLEGYLVMRPPLDIRLVAGVTLLAGSSWWLLREETEEPRLGLLR